MAIYQMFKELAKKYPLLRSFTIRRECDTCAFSSEELGRPFVPLQLSNINLQHIQKYIHFCANEQNCPHCSGTTKMCQQFNDVLVFDIEPFSYDNVNESASAYIVSIGEIAKSITVADRQYTLKGIVEYEQRHFISHIRRKHNEWETYDDLSCSNIRKTPKRIFPVQLFYVIKVILMNLLVGIAVNDIQALKKNAELSKLVRQTELILYIESALFKKYLPAWLRKILHNTALVSPQAYHTVLCLKPLNPGEKQLPKDILMRAYDVAKERKLIENTNSSSDIAEVLCHTDKFKIYNNNGKGLAPPDSDSALDTVSLCALTSKIDENAEKLDSLSNEIRELKSVLHQNDHVIDQLLVFLANQEKNSINSKKNSA